MRSPSNPIAGDIERWAFDATAVEPVQDWDLILSHCPYEPLYMKLAAASDCPQREFFLALLYLIVGDAVRTNYRTRSLPDIERLLAFAEQEFKSYWLYLWVQRSRNLLATPQTFRYDDWCAGGLARDQER